MSSIDVVESADDELLVDVVDEPLSNADSKVDKSSVDELLFVPPVPPGGGPPNGPPGGGPISLWNLEVSIPLFVRTWSTAVWICDCMLEGSVELPAL